MSRVISALLTVAAGLLLLAYLIVPIAVLLFLLVSEQRIPATLSAVAPISWLIASGVLLGWIIGPTPRPAVRALVAFRRLNRWLWASAVVAWLLVVVAALLPDLRGAGLVLEAGKWIVGAAIGIGMFVLTGWLWTKVQRPVEDAFARVFGTPISAFGHKTLRQLLVVGGVLAVSAAIVAWWLGSYHDQFPRMGWPGVIAVSLLSPVVFVALLALAYGALFLFFYVLSWLLQPMKTWRDFRAAQPILRGRWAAVRPGIRRQIIFGLVVILVSAYLTGPRVTFNYDPVRVYDCGGDNAPANCVPEVAGSGQFDVGVYLSRPSVRLVQVTDQHIWGFDTCSLRNCAR